MATLLWTLAARAIWERRERIGHKLAYAAIIEAWQHDHRETVEAFETADQFAAALRDVAPPLKRKRPLSGWRGIVVRNAHPGEAAIGLSWTRSRDIACWFATQHRGIGDLPDVRPFVFKALLEPESIVAFYNGRNEQEIIVDPGDLDSTAPIWVDGTATGWDELKHDSQAPAAALASWRLAGERYEAQKAHEESAKLAALRREISRRQKPS